MNESSILNSFDSDVNDIALLSMKDAVVDKLPLLRRPGVFEDLEKVFFFFWKSSDCVFVA